MTKTEKQYFKVYEIYGIRQIENGKWIAFNRDYKPLGIVAENYTQEIPDDEFPILGIPNDLEKEKLETIAWDIEKGIITDKNDRTVVFLYQDGCSPLKSKRYLNEYNARLKKLNQFI